MCLWFVPLAQITSAFIRTISIDMAKWGIKKRIGGVQQIAIRDVLMCRNLVQQTNYERTFRRAKIFVLQDGVVYRPAIRRNEQLIRAKKHVLLRVLFGQYPRLRVGDWASFLWMGQNK